MENKYYLKTKIMKISPDDINLIPYDLKNSNIDDLSYEFIQNYDNETILEFFENNYDYLNLDNYDLKDLKNLDNSKLNKLLQDNYYDFVFETYKEYLQCFIINEKDVGLFKKYCNYDIQYDDIKDLYILCIDNLLKDF